ncbi:MAG: RNA polymerase sigma factor [Alphaproteobacteria bacterium]|nr:RNA polymerase sigma factor [Alphaproteobacteria bacterium]
MSETDCAEDDDLMGRAGRGDSAAFSRLVARHGRRAGGLAARFLGNRGEAEEIVQEAFTRLWIKARSWEPGGAQVSTWLHRVVVNLCLDRKRRPGTDPLDAASDVADPSPRGDEIVLAGERSRRVQRAVAALPDRQRAALVLCHFDEMSNVEAAAVLEISVGAIESLLVRARRSLREALDDLAPGLAAGRNA